MTYTDEQYALMEMLEAGLTWVFHGPGHEYEDDMLRYLIGEGIAEPHVDIKGNYYTLSNSGRAVLAAFRKDKAAKAEQQAKDADAEATRLKERAEDRADEERRHRAQNKIAVIMPILTFALGVIAQYFGRIVEFVIEFFH